MEENESKKMYSRHRFLLPEVYLSYMSTIQQGRVFSILILHTLLLTLPSTAYAREANLFSDSEILEELQNSFIKEVPVLSDPPSHPVALEVDNQTTLWVVDKVTPKKIKKNHQTVSSQNFRIVNYKDSDGDGTFEKSNIFLEWSEEHWSQTYPVIHVEESALYLGTGSQLSIIRDIDQDGTADMKRVIVPESGRSHSRIDVGDIKKSPNGWLFFSMLDSDFNDSNLKQKNITNPASAIFKCRPDGSNIQKFATGLNQPGDLVFDAIGNLFTSDKNLLSPGSSRWIYVISGGDYGYRNKNLETAVPYIPERTLRPHLSFPHVSNIQGQFDKYAYAFVDQNMGNKTDFFYACESEKKSKKIYAFSQKPEKAFFIMTGLNQRDVNMSPSDITLGPKGQLYLTNIENETGAERSSNIYTIFQNKKKYTPERNQVAFILKEDLKNKPIKSLVKLLQHSNQRVRMKAHSALVQRGVSSVRDLVNVSKDPQNLKARLHAMWAIGQLIESDRKLAEGIYIQSWIADLLEDPSTEIRAQAAILAGSIGSIHNQPNIVGLLKDPSERVRLMAADALGKMKIRSAWDAILEFVASTENQNPILIHAGATAMAGAGTEEAISRLASHPNQQVRRTSILALRFKNSVKIGAFFKDKSPSIVLEVARSIHELPIQEAYSQLANLHQSKDELIAIFKSEDLNMTSGSPIEMFYYVYHANFLLGKAVNLNNIVSAASDESLPVTIREMCQQWVRIWMKPSKESISIAPTLLQADELKASKEILKEVAKSWLESSNKNQQEIMLDYVELFNWKEFQEPVSAVFKQFNAAPTTRSTALKLLFKWLPNQITPLLNEALISNSALLRKEAVLIQAKLNPNDRVAHWTHQLEYGDYVEQQEALLNISNLPDRRVDAVILHWLEQALDESIPPNLNDHLQRAAKRRTPPAIKKALKQWQRNKLSSNGSN